MSDIVGVKTELLAGMSHELRTPLNSILGFTEVLLDEEHGEHSGATVRRAPERAAALAAINDIVDHARIEAVGSRWRASAARRATRYEAVMTVQPLADAKQSRHRRSARRGHAEPSWRAT